MSGWPGLSLRSPGERASRRAALSQRLCTPGHRRLGPGHPETWTARRRMRPDVVVDIGNTRIKWGAVGPSGIARVASLPDDPAAWQARLAEWIESAVVPAGAQVWALASVQPARCARLGQWLESAGHRVRLVTRAADLP